MNQQNIDIRSGGLQTPEVIALLQQHLEEMANLSPAESVHALDLHALQQPEISFWTAWIGDEVAGCAALKQLDTKNAEIKSMRTNTYHQRTGVASELLSHLIAQAKKQNYNTLLLETGSMPAFTAAKSLYEKFGFELCEPFSDYVEDPHSIFMQLNL